MFWVWSHTPGNLAVQSYSQKACGPLEGQNQAADLVRAPDVEKAEDRVGRVRGEWRGDLFPSRAQAACRWHCLLLPLQDTKQRAMIEL